MAQKPSIPKGTRDFLPFEMMRRHYIFDVIKSAFIKYGFMPIETPAMEKTETLLGKYGEEGDRLIFRIMSRGRKLESALSNLLSSNPDSNLSAIVQKDMEEALRYDLTVPFARFVVQHQNDIAFPFKRYQIQPVWRADRPQRGRYREFFQCDADIVGSDSLLYEIELIQIYDEVLNKLGFKDFTIKINNRKILSGIAEISGISDKLIDMTVAIDKLDKIGVEGVIKELKEREISQESIEVIQPLFEFGKNNFDNLNKLKLLFANSEIGKKGVQELEFVLENIEALGLQKAKLELDVTLARGLNYYTGAIFEVKTNEVEMGSICGGGRYDDLTGIFGLSDVSGVGISFGADRIYDVMEELNLFPDTLLASTQLLFINFGAEEAQFVLSKLKELREAGVSAEIYPESAKMKKQMKYANDKNVPFVAMIGANEMVSDKVNLKDMTSGEQVELGWNDFKKQMTNGNN